MRFSHDLDRVRVIFDDPHAVANAGLMLTATLAQHLGIESVVDELVDLGERPGSAHPGRKVMTLVHSIVAGGDSIDDCDVLRSGSTRRVLGHTVMAPSTIGTFLRSFTFGHVRQLDKVAEALLTRAWGLGAGPGDGPLTIDLDSTVCEVHGHRKQGATYGYTRQRGYHPLLATAAASGEVLHARMRKGSANSSRGAVRFLDELAARLRRAGATGELTLRADSGFFSDRFPAACRRHKICYSITARQVDAVKRAIEAIPEDAWVSIDYTDGGVAEVAETTYKDDRLVVRRSRLVGRQAQLWPDWRHHAFVTNRQGSAVDLDVDHRAHARMELALRDLKEGSGLNHCPSGRFFANGAWLLIAALAHNLVRWVAALGMEVGGLVDAKTVRRRFLALPGRLTRSGRIRTMHLPIRDDRVDRLPRCSLLCSDGGRRAGSGGTWNGDERCGFGGLDHHEHRSDHNQRRRRAASGHRGDRIRLRDVERQLACRRWCRATGKGRPAHRLQRRGRPDTCYDRLHGARWTNPHHRRLHLCVGNIWVDGDPHARRRGRSQCRVRLPGRLHADHGPRKQRDPRQRRTGLQCRLADRKFRDRRHLNQLQGKHPGLDIHHDEHWRNP
jgi:hypothetical protein